MSNRNRYINQCGILSENFLAGTEEQDILRHSLLAANPLNQTMKRKKEMQDTETLDSLLERKEQTDTALAELADSLREKLRRVEAAVGKRQAINGNSRQRKVRTTVTVIVVLIGTFWLGTYIGGKSSPVPEPIPAPMPIPTPSILEMTQREADLVRGAIELVREDVVESRLTTTALTLDALSSLLPSGVRDAVLKELGTPNMDFMRDALDILDGKLP